MKIKNIFQSNYTEWNKRQPIPIIASPIASEADRLNEKNNGGHSQSEAEEPPSSSEHPILKKNRKATSMELLFDLFFVGALATFNSAHDITTSNSVKSYISFITVLWFYWLQATIFDVRFYTDSLVGRIFKVLHIGIMTGFGIVAVKFDVNELAEKPIQFQGVCYLLMASRVVLIAQYIPVAWYIRGYKSTFMAKLITIATLSIAAIIFLGLGLGAEHIHSSRAHSAWYIVIAFEGVTMITISSFWEILSFKGTPIVERFIGLTLIVLGEGIVGMTDSLKSIAMGTTDISGTSLGLILCHILIICFVYALYHDQISENRFGYIRQQFWAILHFPLHISILITSKGSRSFILYQVAVTVINNAFNSAIMGLPQAKTASDIVNGLKSAVEALSDRLITTDGKPDFNPIYDKILAIKDISQSRNEVLILASKFQAQATIWILHTFSLEVKDARQTKGGAEDGDAALAELRRILGAATIVFRFFLVAAGLTLIVLALLHWFSKSHKSRAEFLSVIITTTFGVFLSLLSIISLYDVPNKITVLQKYIDSAWLTPTVVLTYLAVIIIDNVIIWVSHTRRSKREPPVAYGLVS